MQTQLEEVELATSAPNSGPSVADDIKSRSARRWFFNPAARIDVRDRITGNEINEQGQSVARSFIKAGVLVPIDNVTYNVPRPKDQPPPPGAPASQQKLKAETKYAKDIADELAFAYADTGALIIESLTGVEDEQLVRSIFRLCVGPQIKIATDPMLPGEKIPVIPAMLENLTREAPQAIERAFADKDDPNLRATTEETRRLLIAACNTAVGKWARFNTTESRKSISDRAGGHPGKSEFDARDRRAFAALGESIPTDIQATNPTMEKAVEILLKKELEKPAEDPRIAQLEAALKEQGEKFNHLSASIAEIQAAKKPGRQPSASA